MGKLLRIGLLVGLLSLAASSAQAFLNVTVGSTSDLTQIQVGESFTLDITVEETLGGGAYALGLRAANYDPGVIDFQTAMAPASIFNFSPSVPVGGITNSAIPDEQAPLSGVRAGWSVNLFQGVTTGSAASGGPDSFSVTFMGAAPGMTTIDVGAFSDYSDTYLGPDTYGGDQFGSVNITVVPEPGTALLMGLGLAGLAVRRR